MQIGGIDFYFPRPELTNEQCLEKLEEAIIKYWPNYHREDDPMYGEYFYYKEERFKDIWDELGLVEETNQTMIYVILRDKQITLVHNEGNEPIIHACYEKVTGNVYDSLYHFETVVYPNIWHLAYDLGVNAFNQGLPNECNLKGTPFCHNDKPLKVYQSAWHQGWEKVVLPYEFLQAEA